MEFKYIADKFEKATTFFGNTPEIGDYFDFFLIEKDKDSFVVATILEKEKDLIEEKYRLEESTTSSRIQRLWIK